MPSPSILDRKLWCRLFRKAQKLIDQRRLVGGALVEEGITW